MTPHRLATPPTAQDDDMAMAYSNQSEAPSLASRRPLLPGIYVPTPCFFSEDEELDLATISRHAVRLAQAGVAGITTQGSNGEAVHLTPGERRAVTQETRNALDKAGFPSFPVIVGCGAQSTREAIGLCRDAAESGGDYVLVLAPSYYKAAYTRSSLLAFFRAIADASPLPVMIYNYPGAAAGTDLDSGFLLELAAHPNICGVKLTCANVGKLARVAAGTSLPLSASKEADVESSPQFLHTPKSTPASSISDLVPDDSADSRLPNPQFITLAGSADFLLPALSVGAQGGLVGLANIVPKTCVALQRAYEQHDTKKAAWLQAVLARSDEWVQKFGVVGTKAVLQACFNYGGHARRPLPRLGEGVTEKEIHEWVQGFREVMEVENSLP